jgi:hypothetical protein
MRAVQKFGVGFISLIALVAMAMPATVYAAELGSGLTGSVGRPGTQWSTTLTANPGEVVNVLIQYTNKNQTNQQYVTITNALPKGATFNATSAYLYTPSSPSGTQQADTLTTSGIRTGLLKPGETAAIQFQMTMPSADKLACGANDLVNTINGVSRSGNKAYSAQNTIRINKQCQAPAPATNTTKPTPPAAATTTQAVAPVTTTTTAASAPATATTTTTTASTQSTASKSDSGKESLVNTGAGSVFGLFAAVAIIGAAFHRFVIRPRILND